jgi:hypothetical protein
MAIKVSPATHAGLAIGCNVLQNYAPFHVAMGATSLLPTSQGICLGAHILLSRGERPVPQSRRRVRQSSKRHGCAGGGRCWPLLIVKRVSPQQRAGDLTFPALPWQRCGSMIEGSHGEPAMKVAIALMLCTFLVTGKASAQAESGPEPVPGTVTLPFPGLMVTPPRSPPVDTQQTCPDTGRKLELVG